VGGEGAEEGEVCGGWWGFGGMVGGEGLEGAVEGWGGVAIWGTGLVFLWWGVCY
jgi:hypothetical protein